jgi:ABC-type glycerol-3-phosphate transport system permease component
MDERRFKKRIVFLILYLVFAILPVYWMVNMSFKTNEEILSIFSFWPRTSPGTTTRSSSPMCPGIRATSTR